MLPKRFVYICALLVALVAPPSALVAGPANTLGTEQRRECIVYVTRTGHRYHKDGCRYLRYSRIPMSKQRAEASGFTPCHVCGGSDC